MLIFLWIRLSLKFVHLNSGKPSNFCLSPNSRSIFVVDRSQAPVVAVGVSSKDAVQVHARNSFEVRNSFVIAENHFRHLMEMLRKKNQ